MTSSIDSNNPQPGRAKIVGNVFPLTTDDVKLHIPSFQFRLASSSNPSKVSSITIVLGDRHE